MTTKQAMDLFGEALEAYSKGDRSSFCLKDSSGRTFVTDLSRYFRPPDRISGLEGKLISLAYGDILDVGCGTGNYFPLMTRRGRVVGIDVSPKVIEVAKKRGCRDCRVADVFTFQTKKRFDTITLLGNGLGIGGTLIGTRQLLKTLSSMLKDDGQILVIGRRVIGRDYVAVQLRPVWKQRTGKGFRWIHLGRDVLSRLVHETGLCLKVLQGNQHYYLMRITKRRPQPRSIDC